jgi:hypothetical protein
VKHKLMRMVVALGLVALGWVAAKAQNDKPTFELLVDAPEGETRIECARGCELSWVERGVNPNARPIPEFRYSCTNSRSGRCGSGHIGGWVTP